MMWEIREPNGEGNGFKVGLAWIGEDLQGKGREAAYLISVVEELYEALEHMVNVCPAIDPSGEEAHKRAREVLAQARGEG